MTAVTLLRTRMEVAAPRRGRPGFRWAPGYHVVGPDGAKLYPPCRRAEAYETARALYPGCTITVKEDQ